MMLHPCITNSQSAGLARQGADTHQSGADQSTSLHESHDTDAALKFWEEGGPYPVL